MANTASLHGKKEINDVLEMEIKTKNGKKVMRNCLWSLTENIPDLDNAEKINELKKRGVKVEEQLREALQLENTSRRPFADKMACEIQEASETSKDSSSSNISPKE
eukprot:IDg22835t1